MEIFIGLCVSLSTMRSSTVMSPRFILLHRRSCNNRRSLVLSAIRLLQTVKFILTLAQTFEIAHRVLFVAARTKDFLEDLRASNVFNKSSKNSCRHLPNFLLRCPAVPGYIEREAAHVFGTLIFRIIFFSNPLRKTRLPYSWRRAGT